LAERTNRNMAEPAKEPPEAPKRRFSDEVFNSIVAALREKKVQDACPRCRTSEWNVDAGSLVASVGSMAGFSIPPPTLPVLIFTCANCGFIAMHHLQALGLDLKALGILP